MSATKDFYQATADHILQDANLRLRDAGPSARRTSSWYLLSPIQLELLAQARPVLGEPVAGNQLVGPCGVRGQRRQESSAGATRFDISTAGTLLEWTVSFSTRSSAAAHQLLPMSEADPRDPHHVDLHELVRNLMYHEREMGFPQKLRLRIADRLIAEPTMFSTIEETTRGRRYDLLDSMKRLLIGNNTVDCLSTLASSVRQEQKQAEQGFASNYPRSCASVAALRAEEAAQRVQHSSQRTSSSAMGLRSSSDDTLLWFALRPRQLDAAALSRTDRAIARVSSRLAQRLRQGGVAPSTDLLQPPAKGHIVPRETVEAVEDRIAVAESLSYDLREDPLMQACETNAVQSCESSLRELPSSIWEKCAWEAIQQHVRRVPVMLREGYCLREEQLLRDYQIRTQWIRYEYRKDVAALQRAHCEITAQLTRANRRLVSQLNHVAKTVRRLQSSVASLRQRLIEERRASQPMRVVQGVAMAGPEEVESEDSGSGSESSASHESWEDTEGGLGIGKNSFDDRLRLSIDAVLAPLLPPHLRPENLLSEKQSVGVQTTWAPEEPVGRYKQSRVIVPLPSPRGAQPSEDDMEDWAIATIASGNGRLARYVRGVAVEYAEAAAQRQLEEDRRVLAEALATVKSRRPIKALATLRKLLKKRSPRWQALLSDNFHPKTSSIAPSRRVSVIAVARHVRSMQSTALRPQEQEQAQAGVPSPRRDRRAAASPQSREERRRRRSSRLSFLDSSSGAYPPSLGGRASLPQRLFPKSPNAPTPPPPPRPPPSRPPVRPSARSRRER